LVSLGKTNSFITVSECDEFLAEVVEGIGIKIME